MKQRFTRQELHSAVWSKPMRTVAQALGMSDVALAKVCRKANIIVPPRGYWARRQAGKSAHVVPLPPRFPGDTDYVGGEHRPYYGADWREKQLAEPIPPVPVFDESMESVAARVPTIVGKVKYMVGFETAHQHIAKLLAQDEARLAKQKKYGWEYDKPRYQDGVGRRWLLILNSLFLAFRRIGCPVSMSTSKYDRTEFRERQAQVRVGIQHFTLKLGFISKSVRATESNDGRLRLDLCEAGESAAVHTWEDGTGRRLERCLTQIVTQLLLAAETRYREAAIAGREHLIAHRAELAAEIVRIRAENERKEREAAEKRRQDQVEQLLRQAEQLDRANQIRAYIGTVSGLVSENSTSQKQVERWSNWALLHADRIDPVKNGALSSAIVGLETDAYP